MTNATATRLARALAVSSLVLVLTACAAGPGSDWAEEGADPAGFVFGFWHGLLLIITLIVSFFTDQVSIYEVHNTGLSYNIGFVLGTLAAYGSGVRVTMCSKKPKPHGVDHMAHEVEERVRLKIEGALENDEWKDLGERVEAKVKEKLRRWLDEEDTKGG
jgi:hypothetical protein